jgi:hypothetical protein
MNAVILSIFVIIFALVANASSIYLTKRQMYLARGILLNPRATPAQRASVQSLLYTSHENWAIKQAREFKCRFQSCKNIPTKDFILSSKLGLLKSLRKYNGATPFVRFSEIYVKSELIRTLKLHSKSNVIATIENPETIESSQESAPSSSNTDFYETAWSYVNTFDAFTVRVLHLKYDPEFAVKSSNRQIANIMCCSEETVRKSVAKFSAGMRQDILCKYASV